MDGGEGGDHMQRRSTRRPVERPTLRLAVDGPHVRAEVVEAGGKAAGERRRIEDGRGDGGEPVRSPPGRPRHCGPRTPSPCGPQGNRIRIFLENYFLLDRNKHVIEVILFSKSGSY